MSSDHSGTAKGRHAFDSNDIRKRLGFPKNANRWITLLVYPALTPMLALRRKVGVRMVSFSRLLGAYAVMLIWGGIVGGLLAAIATYQTHDLPSVGDFAKNLAAEQMVRFTAKLPDILRSMIGVPEPAAKPTVTFGGVIDDFTLTFGELFYPMFKFGLLTLVLGLVHRSIRWVSRQAGEQLNTKSLGISLIPLPIRNNSIERYLDPLLCAAVGWWVFNGAWPLVGAWVVFCAVSLGVVEKYVHEIQLDQYDDLLNAEAHEQISAAYLSGMHKGGERAAPSKPVATGMSDDVKKRMAERLRRQSTQPMEASAPSQARIEVQQPSQAKLERPPRALPLATPTSADEQNAESPAAPERPKLPSFLADRR